MDDSLLNHYIHQVILPLYPNISKMTAFDRRTGKLLHDVVILKLDSGPGRIVASYDSILKREALVEMGLLVMSGLRNATSVQQEMDVLYGAFKSGTYDLGEMMLMEKLRKRGVATRNGNVRVAAAAAASILTLGLKDLATTVNGHADDDISRQPFDKNFTKETIVHAWCNVDFVSFTWNCLSNKKVRHNKLVQTVANKELESLQVWYDNLVSVGERQGLNRRVFDVALPVSCQLNRVHDEGRRIQ
jgi:hypothetical protein